MAANVCSIRFTEHKERERDESSTAFNLLARCVFPHVCAQSLQMSSAREKPGTHTQKKNRPCIGVLVTAQKLGKQAPIDNWLCNPTYEWETIGRLTCVAISAPVCLYFYIVCGSKVEAILTVNVLLFRTKSFSLINFENLYTLSVQRLMCSGLPELFGFFFTSLVNPLDKQRPVLLLR